MEILMEPKRKKTPIIISSVLEPERRKKVTKACDYCKKRKYKCSGKSPCYLCEKKKIECKFSIVDKRTTKVKKKKGGISKSTNSHPDGIAASSSEIAADALVQSNSYVDSAPDGSSSKDNLGSKPKAAYIPKSLQPLLSFPLGEDGETVSDDEGGYSKPMDDDEDMPEEDQNGIESLSNNYGKSSRLLFDSAGNLRYIGESSPLSLLFECRNIFLSTIGSCEFTSDPQGVNIIDEPGKIKNGIPVQLPKREHCNILVKFFESNVNSTWYVFNMRYFKEYIVDYIYDNPIRARPEKLVLLHLVLALGLLYAETSKSFLIEDLESSSINSLAFFESGCNLMRNTVDDGKLWLSEAYLLIYFYYQSTSKRSTSWIMLGTAIRNAQALGLHRKFINESFRDREYIMHRRKLWRSLYVCDRSSSILLGRPLLIGDYDWDDFDNVDLIDYEDKINHDKNIYCLIEIAKVCKINGKIVHNFYLDGMISPARAEKLAIELKLWSINLPKELQIDRILRGTNSEVSSDKFALLLLHLSQLYGIMLLSKPFFMYIAFKSNIANNSGGSVPPRRNRHEATMVNFCKASVKSSVLTIQLINLYRERHPQRIESYTTVNCCFMAALILGLSILHRKNNPEFQDEYNIALLMETLNTAKIILSFYGPINATSQRFYKIVGKMQRSLEAAYGDMEHMISSSVSSPNNIRDGIFSTPSAAPLNIAALQNHSLRGGNASDLEALMNFQQFFVPSASKAGGINEDFATQSTTSSAAGEPLEAFMYNMGTNDILFDGNI
ncbi:zinc finger transcription factor of the Zn(2)-Cys(6) binuclear cluster domain type [Scheffersomyces stipitis CBS 6054]|uniref:Zinc finger transcription factor of the Zn(2)-Cys(6) binuclear cluster domain type n=1 Tax=Scheffersomyces stipitis (strain ATCC 58785 / CBS 6054 / NBRC 10063 / NRRL Y-11545) TaxID=322104 RepID=A3GGI0_PICST|nr:zinc finger transcription factor of the Zn(2)-Cys(6) binuclear cluster domain type [Scheffersomyces stipitis CBS 6054]EAZ63935.2 zinc finger transcription factor of the Zn(2)-Cys(6) binuclear cluster domain type [Scheffersomyces stipitis CBS 6054]